jgi:hypothetical protein
MLTLTAKRVVNSTIWIVCGGLVIMIRFYFARGPSLIIWEGVGATMMVYGAFRLVWALMRGAPKQTDESIAPPVHKKVTQ